MSRDFGIFMPKHLAGQWRVNSNKQINDTAEWVSAICIELKKRLIEKQQMEQQNQEIYNYMHDIFGAEVVNLFDMKYNPEQK